MRKLISICLFISCFGAATIAQTLEIDWGNFQEIEKGTFFQKFLGTDEDGFFVVRSDNALGCANAKVWLEYFSSGMYSMDASNELLMPSANGMQTTYEEMFYINGKLILFTSAIDPHRKQKIAFVQYIGKDGTLQNKPKEIGNLPIQNGKFSFEYTLSEDGTKILFHYHKFFAKYGDEEIIVKAFDSNLKEELNKKLILPLKERTFEILQYKFGNSGNIYMGLKLEPEAKGRKSSTGVTVYEFSVLCYDKTKNDFYNQEIIIKKNNPKEMIIGLDNDEIIVAAGYYTNKTARNGEILGFFFNKIDPRIRKVISGNIESKDIFMPIAREHLTEFTAKRFGDDLKRANDYRLCDILFMDNGMTVFLGEQTSVDTTFIKEPGSNSVLNVLNHNYTDILAAGITKEGKITWYNRIPKNQSSVDDGGYYSSFKALVNGSKIKILYNDGSKPNKLEEREKISQFKNNVQSSPRGQSSTITIYNDGSFDKSVMFNNSDLKTIYIPSSLGKGGERFYIGGIKGKYYKFGSFSF